MNSTLCKNYVGHCQANKEDTISLDILNAIWWCILDLEIYKIIQGWKIAYKRSFELNQLG